MALLSPIQSKITGAVATGANAGASGDTFRPGPYTLIVSNTDSGAHSVVIAVPGSTKYGQDAPDVTVAVAAGVTSAIGPFPDDLADSADGLVHVTYTPNATGVKVALVRV